MKIDPRQANVELHIEELVLHGFEPGDRYAIAEAVERELGRLFAEQGMPAEIAEPRDLVRLNAGSFDVVAEVKADNVGTQVAQTLYGGLNQ